MQMARISVTTMAPRKLDMSELTARPNATASAAKTNRNANATMTSTGVTPPKRNGSAPTGASTTMCIAIEV